ncbi:hypothetical protein O181_095102 [Austropuccinia psidii MF-1]|uniref:Uncharacterized protein n=1 Tax=Austropuccinia psidii MF-1 TaxID=1389203 RepID=A0A9Q3J461_9BASI|nr:hypothetical protein [Austropuccinia psidii MF-1]
MNNNSGHSREAPNNPSNHIDVDPEVEIIPQKGKKKRGPSGGESIQGSAIAQRKVIEMPIISETELKLKISNSNGNKSYSEGSNRHIHEPVQMVPHSTQRQGLGNVTSNPPRSDELLAYPQGISPEEGNSEILKWIEFTIIQA